MKNHQNIKKAIELLKTKGGEERAKVVHIFKRQHGVLGLSVELKIIPLTTKDIARAMMEGLFDELFGVNFKVVRGEAGGEPLFRKAVSEVLLKSNEMLQTTFRKKLKIGLLLNEQHGQLEEHVTAEKPWDEYAMEMIARAAGKASQSGICSLNSLKRMLQSEEFELIANAIRSEAITLKAECALSSGVESVSVASVPVNQEAAAWINAPNNKSMEQLPDSPAAPPCTPPPATPPPLPIQLPPPSLDPASPKRAFESSPSMSRSTKQKKAAPHFVPVEEDLPASVPVAVPVRLAKVQRQSLHKDDPTADSLRESWLAEIYKGWQKLMKWTKEEKKKGIWSGTRAYMDVDEFDENGLKFIVTAGNKCKSLNRTDNYIDIQKDSRIFRLLLILSCKPDKGMFRSANNVGKFVCEGGIVDAAIRSGQIPDINKFV